VTVVQYLAAAETDLVEIWLQIAGDGDYNHADEYISRLQEICVLLAGQPGMGVDRQDIAMGVRSFSVDRYVVYYEQHGSVLSVLRIWHTARDPETLSIAE
jgi:toxin ParE1/3/4